MLAITNGRCILPDEAGNFTIQTGKAILCEGDKIKAIVSADDALLQSVNETIDAEGNYVSPGFLNVHIHGCDGMDTMDDAAEALPRMSRLQAKTGVTGFLPTTMTCAWDEVARAFSHIRHYQQHQPEGARILGAHMEGPFISPAKKGAQAECNIRPADFELVEPWQDVVRIITLAPEELTDYRFVELCEEAGITVSVGHTAADYDMVMDAINNHGVHHITHLYNAMTPFHHRNPGVVGAALDSAANCEIIADNIHSHPAAQRLLYRAKGGRNIILITDSLRACGIGDGPSELGGQAVFVKGELATLADGTIAGSVATMNRCVAHFQENTGAPLPLVIEMVTKTPAQELGLYDELGSLTAGKRADIVIFDEAIAIQQTIIGGKLFV